MFPTTTTLLTALTPSIPILALTQANATFRYKFSRAAVIAATGASAIWTISFADIKQRQIAYLIGLLSAWTVIRTFTFFWLYDPKRFLALEVVKSAAGFQAKWQPCPAKSSISRLFWSTRLFIDFRAIDWCYSASEGKPCNFHTKKLTAKLESLHPETGRMVGTQSLLMAVRLIFSFSCLQVTKTYMFPYFRDALLQQTSSDRPWWFMMAEHLVSIVATFALADIVHAATRLVCCFLSYLGFWTNLITVIEPSPWGSPFSIYTHGLAGFWAYFWHDYFRLGFQTVSRWLCDQTTGWLSKPMRKALQLHVVFFMSGIMHMSGSFMFRGHNRPITSELVFYMLQPFGMMFQSQLSAALCKDNNYLSPGRLVNGCFTVAWLYYTLPLLCSDLILGGFWEKGSSN